MIKVENHSDLYKTKSGAVVSADWDAYKRAKEKKKEKERLNILESKMDKIEALLEQLVKKI